MLVGQAREPAVDRAAFHDWLAREFAANVPWNELVRDLLTASGQSSAVRPKGTRVAASAGALVLDAADVGGWR